MFGVGGFWLRVPQIPFCQALMARIVGALDCRQVVHSSRGSR